MNEIAMVKKEIRLAQWAEMVRNRNESGLTVTDWCKENGINLKTYYYRLKRIRQAVARSLDSFKERPHDRRHLLLAEVKLLFLLRIEIDRKLELLFLDNRQEHISLLTRLIHTECSSLLPCFCDYIITSP